MRRLAAMCVAAAAAMAVSGCPGGGGGRPAGGGRSFPVVVIETSQGTIRAELWPDKSPLAVQNFLQYVDDGFYDGTIFHRCIRGFMIQGGGVTPDWREKRTRAAIRNESANSLRNVRGTLAMARTSQPHSATSQFFINTVDNQSLDHNGRDFGYAVFGQVTSGMDVVDRIEQAPVVGDERAGRPAQPVVIRSIRRVGK